jgi:hypothetical protein
MTEMDQSITSVVDDLSETISDVRSPASSQATSESSVERGRASSAKKRKSSESSCSDKSGDQLSNYFTARVAHMQNKVNKETKVLDDDELFGQMITSDLKKITNMQAKRRLRKKLSDVMYEALEEQDLENEREQQEFAQLFLAQSQC